MLLMLLAPDQMLFPVLSAAMALLWVLALTKKSPQIGVLAGAISGLAVFTSFSLLPVLAFGVALWGLAMIFAGGEAERKRQLYVALGVVGGGVAVSMALALAFDYNPFGRWLSAMALHREIKEFEFTPGSLLRYGVLNTMEFAMWAGLPLVVLAAVATWGSLASVARGTPSRGDMFNTALLGMYLMLNVVGQTRGEVGRLWLFLIPLMAVAAGKEAEEVFPRPVWGAMFVLALQLSSSVVAFYRLDWPW